MNYDNTFTFICMLVALSFFLQRSILASYPYSFGDRRHFQRKAEKYINPKMLNIEMRQFSYKDKVLKERNWTTTLEEIR